MRTNQLVLLMALLLATPLLADEPPLEPIPLPAPVAKANEPTPAAPPNVAQTGLQTPLEGPIFPDATTVIVEEEPRVEALQPVPAQPSPSASVPPVGPRTIERSPASIAPVPRSQVGSPTAVVPAPAQTTYQTTQTYYVTPLGRVLPAAPVQRVVYFQAAPPAVTTYRVGLGPAAVLDIQVANPPGLVTPPPGYVPGQPVRNLIRSMRW